MLVQKDTRKGEKYYKPEDFKLPAFRFSGNLEASGGYLLVDFLVSSLGFVDSFALRLECLDSLALRLELFDSLAPRVGEEVSPEDFSEDPPDAPTDCFFLLLRVPSTTLE